MKHLQSILGVIAIFTALIGPASYGEPRVAQQIPAGTLISVRMIDSISSDYNQPGQTFRASLAEPVRIGNRTLVPRGANATVRLVEAKSAGHLKGRSGLTLQLDRVGPYHVQS